jgi:hypothetical protein
MNHLVIVHDGELSKDVAAQVLSRQSQQHQSKSIQVSLRSASDRPKNFVSEFSRPEMTTVVCFIVQTIENSSPTEDVSAIDL